MFPQGPFGAQFFQNGLEKCTAQLLDLIHQEGQHHYLDEDHAQVLLAKAVIVLEVVPLVFQSVESFIFDFPPGPASPHDPIDVVLTQWDVGNPAETLGDFAGYLPVFEDVDQDIGVGCIYG